MCASKRVGGCSSHLGGTSTRGGSRPIRTKISSAHNHQPIMSRAVVWHLKACSYFAVIVHKRCEHQPPCRRASLRYSNYEDALKGLAHDLPRQQSVCCLFPTYCRHQSVCFSFGAMATKMHCFPGRCKPLYRGCDVYQV